MSNKKIMYIKLYFTSTGAFLSKTSSKGLSAFTRYTVDCKVTPNKVVVDTEVFSVVSKNL